MSDSFDIDLFDKACERFKYRHDCTDSTLHCYNCTYYCSLLCSSYMHEGENVIEEKERLSNVE